MAPLEARMLKVYVPAGVEGLALTVSETEAVPPEPSVTVPTIEAEAPAGWEPTQPTDNTIVPLKPLIEEKLTSCVAEAP
jgi:hypothetical protein